ncbi:MAG: hypothetical protein M0Z51_09625 [Propionibacterium sp.]|nr:hypothetical protein [Propionibacterium sp.]
MPLTGSTDAAAGNLQGSCDFRSAPLTPAEVRELWAFIHGDIMIGGIRQQLRASFGPCPRHTWGYALVEIELWIHGAGSRGGHQPFDVCVLYADLLEHVAGRLQSRGHVFPAPLAKTLARHGPCRVCNSLTTDAHDATAQVGFAGSNAVTLAAEANELRYTIEWFQQTRDIWTHRVCPTCALRLGRPGSPNHGGPEDGVLCLEHVREPGGEVPTSLPALAEYLTELGARVDALGNSMRQGATAPTREENASWVEALGWFAGWVPPLSLADKLRVAAKAASDPHRDTP